MKIGMQHPNNILQEAFSRNIEKNDILGRFY